MRPSHPTPVRDAALLLARLVLGTIVVAHGHQQLLVDGLGRTAHGLAHMSTSVAIMAASVAVVVELIGGLLLAIGLAMRSAAVTTGLVLVGSAAYVHVPHGLLAGGGWVLASALGGGLAALAAAGPGRWSVTHLARARSTARPSPAGPPVTDCPSTGSAPSAEPIPPAGLPLVPIVRLAPGPLPLRPSGR